MFPLRVGTPPDLVRARFEASFAEQPVDERTDGPSDGGTCACKTKPTGKGAGSRRASAPTTTKRGEKLVLQELAFVSLDGPTQQRYGAALIFQYATADGGHDCIVYKLADSGT
jgi:hypothetical protein